MRRGRFFVSVALALLSATGAVRATEVVENDAHTPIAACSYGLPQRIESKLKPFLLAWAASQRGEQAEEKTIALFESLLLATGPEATEARIALMAYYVGEHSGEELVCAILAEPQGALALVEKYSACRPLTSFESELKGVAVLGTLYVAASSSLAKGEKC